MMEEFKVRLFIFYFGGGGGGWEGGNRDRSYKRLVSLRYMYRIMATKVVGY